MYISKVKIQNWKNFSFAETDLSSIVYILGSNASGKSNFLDIFRFLRDIAKEEGGGLQHAVQSRGGMKKIRCLAARRNPVLSIELEFSEKNAETPTPLWKYKLALENEQTGRHRVLVKEESAWHKGKLLFQRPQKEDKTDGERLTQTYLEQINQNKEFRDVVNYFKDVLYLHLIPQLLKFDQYVLPLDSSSDPFGQGLLEEIASTPLKTRESRLRKVEKTLQGVIPNFEKLRQIQDSITGRPHLEMRYKHWRKDAGWQREDQFSDGTLRLIGLMWTLLSTNCLVLLEEPELSLNEEIVAQIPGMIYNIQKFRKTEGQIFISTHSRAMLSGNDIQGNFLILSPTENGEGTTIYAPSADDCHSMQSGAAPSDVLLPQVGPQGSRG